MLQLGTQRPRPHLGNKETCEQIDQVYGINPGVLKRVITVASHQILVCKIKAQM